MLLEKVNLIVFYFPKRIQKEKKLMNFGEKYPFPKPFLDSLEFNGILVVFHSLNTIQIKIKGVRKTGKLVNKSL